MSSASSSQVRVGVRIRPFGSSEIQQSGKAILDVQSPSVGLGQRLFTYDEVFDANVGQQELYESVAGPLLNSFLDGYNATIMAYGQTGSGKTFTMGIEAHADPEIPTLVGLIPRFLSDIFDNLSKAEGDDQSQGLQKYEVTASFLEVYGEDVHDLLDDARVALPLREDLNGGVVVVGLTARKVSDIAQALQVLHEGTMNRTTGATLMNDNSNRSHAVFAIDLVQTTNTDDLVIVTKSRFTFVDLAGSERIKKTGAEGERAREGIKINEGLLALGNVINALGDEERLMKEKKVHVPYRQSKLTRLLQDALGGNSQTLFLACVSPSDTNASETLSTLHYANRARNIKNAPTKNVDDDSLELRRLRSLTHVLQCELVKKCFLDDAHSAQTEIGKVQDDLFQRRDVQEYLSAIHKVAEGAEGTKQSAELPTIAPPSPSSFDFQPELRKVEGELAEQKAKVLQIRECLKKYRSVKEHYDLLTNAVQNLEAQKEQLEKHLENQNPSIDYSTPTKTENSDDTNGDNLMVISQRDMRYEPFICSWTDLLQYKESLRSPTSTAGFGASGWVPSAGDILLEDYVIVSLHKN